MRSAPNCRWPRTSPTSPRNCARSPSARPIPRRIAAASRIGWRCPASMRGWPRPRRSSTSKPAAAPVGEAAPYANAKEFKADLDILDRSLIANNSRVIARGRLRLLRRAVDCFGFHLASLDIRQNSAVHERTIAELIDAAMPRHVLSGVERRGAHRAAGERIAQHAAADVVLRQIQRRDARRTRGVPRGGRRRMRGSAPRSSPNASFRCARASPTCWRSRCC